MLDPLNRVADNEGCTWNDGDVTTPNGFKEAYKKFADAGWIGLAGSRRIRRSRLAAVTARADARDVERRRTSASPTVRCSIKARSKRSNSSDRTSRSRSTFRISFRASGPARCVSPSRKPARISRSAHQGRSRGRPLPDHRPEDFHHVRRARHGREHHPPRARASARRARRHEGHLDVHRAEGPGQRRRLARRAQRRRVRRHRAQARHQRQPDVHAELRREGRRHRLSGRRSEPRPRVHVHHDERGALLGRRARLSPLPIARTSTRSSTRRSACRGRCRDAQQDAGAHHRASRRAPHADVAEGADRSDARARVRTPRHRSISRTSIRTKKCARSTRRSPSS